MGTDSGELKSSTCGAFDGAKQGSQVSTPDEVVDRADGSSASKSPYQGATPLPEGAGSLCAAVSSPQVRRAGVTAIGTQVNPVRPWSLK